LIQTDCVIVRHEHVQCYTQAQNVGTSALPLLPETGMTGKSSKSPLAEPSAIDVDVPLTSNDKLVHLDTDVQEIKSLLYALIGPRPLSVSPPVSQREPPLDLGKSPTSPAPQESSLTAGLIDLHKELYSMMQLAPLISPEREEEWRRIRETYPRRVTPTAFPPPFMSAATSPNEAAAMTRQLLNRSPK